MKLFLSRFLVTTPDGHCPFHAPSPASPVEYYCSCNAGAPARFADGLAEWERRAQLIVEKYGSHLRGLSSHASIATARQFLCTPFLWMPINEFNQQNMPSFPRIRGFFDARLSIAPHLFSVFPQSDAAALAQINEQEAEHMQRVGRIEALAESSGIVLQPDWQFAFPAVRAGTFPAHFHGMAAAYAHGIPSVSWALLAEQAEKLGEQKRIRYAREQSVRRLAARFDIDLPRQWQALESAVSFAPRAAVSPRQRKWGEKRDNRETCDCTSRVIISHFSPSFYSTVHVSLCKAGAAVR
jgi:hypothetical protein